MKIYELSTYESAFDVYPVYYKRYKYKGAAMRNFRLYADSGKYEKINLFVFDADNYKLLPLATYNKPLTTITGE